jgi:hypothetical protein
MRTKRTESAWDARPMLCALLAIVLSSCRTSSPDSSGPGHAASDSSQPESVATNGELVVGLMWDPYQKVTHRWVGQRDITNDDELAAMLVNERELAQKRGTSFEVTIFFDALVPQAEVSHVADLCRGANIQFSYALGNWEYDQ